MHSLLPKVKKYFSRKFLDKNTQIGKIKNSIFILQENRFKKQACLCTIMHSYYQRNKTWIESVKEGYWINGTTDSMGQTELDQLELITKLRMS